MHCMAVFLVMWICPEAEGIQEEIGLFFALKNNA